MGETANDAGAAQAPENPGSGDAAGPALQAQRQDVNDKALAARVRAAAEMGDATLAQLSEFIKRNDRPERGG